MKTPASKTMLLIIEDDSLIRRMYKEKMENAGFEVLVAKDGKEGELFALKKHPDLIILDLKLPKKNGMEILKTIRKTAWGETVPVIILTVMPADNNESLQNIVENHPAFYIDKSNTTPEDILEKIYEILS